MIRLGAKGKIKISIKNDVKFFRNSLLTSMKSKQGQITPSMDNNSMTTNLIFPHTIKSITPGYCCHFSFIIMSITVYKHSGIITSINVL